MSLNKEFEEIYAKKLWGDGSKVPLSGGGSKPEVAKPYVDFVKRVIDEYRVSTVLDIGHGDWQMWRDYRFEDVNYLGIDVVPSLSEKNNLKYGSKNVSFISGKISEINLPDFDLVITKEVFQHLSNEYVTDLVQKLPRTKLLIISNAIHVKSVGAAIRYLPARIALRSRIRKLLQGKNPFFVVKRRNNVDIANGEWRAINLEDEPFKSALEKYELVEKFLYLGSNYKGVQQAVYLFRSGTP